MHLTQMMKGKKKGIFFSMDSAAALLITMIIVAGVISVLSVSDQPSENALALTRLARDVYEIKNANPSANVPWVKTSCVGESNVGSENALKYDASSNSVTRYVVTVC
ncbi:hypothetical protein H0N95_01170 [Candidatus Micrarchaeota archaeon]|nr:hypothetical protein [Candidatus Micrarchaeota archaeon]